MVLRRCRALLRDEASAVDAMQDTFVQLLTHRARLSDGAPSSLLYRIATRVCLNRIRSLKVRSGYADASENEEALLEIADRTAHEERQIARDFLSRLFATQQESTGVMAVMFFLDGMTLEEIAGEVGMSVSGVRKRLRSFNGKAQKFKEVLA